MDDYKKLRADFERMKKNEHERIADRVLAERAADAEKIAGPDHRDAEIAALKAEVETAKAWQGAAVLRNYDAVRILTEEIGAPGPENIDETARRAVMVIRAHKRALAAGPAALRAQLNVEPTTQEAYARVVEAAQEAAMKEGT